MTQPHSFMAIQHSHSAKGRRYSGQLEVSLATLGISPASWLGTALQEIARTSQIRPMQTNDAATFVRISHVVCEDARTRELFGMEPMTIGRSEMISAFSLAEQLIARITGWSPVTQANASMTFRSQIMRHMEPEHFKDDLRRHAVHFRTKLTERARARKTLSSRVDLSAPKGLQEPLDAIKHANAAELRAKITERMNFDVRRIVEACVKDLEVWAQVRSKLEKLAELDYSPNAMGVGTALLFCGPRKIEKAMPYLWRLKPQEFVGACAKLANGILGNIKRHTLGTNRQLEPWLCEVLEIEMNHLDGIPWRQVLRMMQRAHSHELYELPSVFSLP